ncbi:CsiV family protein [Pontibacter sp. JAM-7]|uniref:CsiV family protein n=1 Tax=Pontibacter sp. JAM-7 TaxID=3366581 RepID=UPI003AF5058B
MTKIYTLLITVLALSASLAHSQELDNWYSIEIIIFSNEESAAVQAETWPLLPEPAQRDAVNLQPAAVDATPYSLMAAEKLTLTTAKAQLQRSGQYRTLLHTGWIQPVQRTQNPTPVRIVAGNILDNGRYELEGYLGIGRGQYLHVRPDLYLNRILSPAQANALEQARSAEPVASAAELNTLPFSLQEVLTVHMDQPRRMRSGEVHYIDHPLFGMVVSINPLQ